jgi:hypothetical protein
MKQRACLRVLVAGLSARDGSATPLGWCANMTAAALCARALFNLKST